MTREHIAMQTACCGDGSPLCPLLGGSTIYPIPRLELSRVPVKIVAMGWITYSSGSSDQ
jgi:hypothetical protein